ncbi:MAG: hypothetical protein Q7U05_15730 [Polaromonas sp.]|nr:hypothetical protein [Polaromonas sp.]
MIKIIISLILVFLNIEASSEDKILGFHAHEPVSIKKAADTGYTAIRLWDTGTDWASLKPEKNLWNFVRINEYLRISENNKLKVLWTIGNTPRWASARPNEKCAYGFGCASEPRDIDDWRKYVYTIAATFRGRIECYEPWNEVSFPNDQIFKFPVSGGDNHQFFTGSVKGMVDLAKVTYEQVKLADPSACVVSPSFHNSGHWAEKFDQYLAAGGGKYVDVISQHFYFDDEPEQVIPTIRVMRQVMAKHGLSHIPIWNTEVGISFEKLAKRWPRMSSEELVYTLILRSYLINFSEGVSRVYWYAWDNNDMGFFSSKLKFDFGSAAASAAIRQINKIESSNCQSTNDLWQCRVKAGDRRFKVVWLAGRNVIPRTVVFKYNATRWNQLTEFFPAGRKIQIDGRPVVVNDDS